MSGQRAVDLIQAAGIAIIQTLLSTPPQLRDAELAEIAPRLDVLSEGERYLLVEWLDRIIGAR